MSASRTIRFYHNGTDWCAQRALEQFIRDEGWSIGPTDITGFRGVLCRPGVLIAKWKNLTPAERATCDAEVRTMSGHGRTAELVLFVRDKSAPTGCTFPAGALVADDCTTCGHPNRDHRTKFNDTAGVCLACHPDRI